MPRDLTLSLNRTCAPNIPFADFLRLAQGTGIGAIELRNDMGGELTAFSRDALREMLKRSEVRVASLNALQRFNDWTPGRAQEAARLVETAQALGAKGIVLCPVIDESRPWGEAEAAGKLREALKGLAPIFAGSGVFGLVEPLGMKGSTLRFQKDAVAAIEEVSGWDVFRLCHDTFQFYRSGDARMYPEHFGMVHVSGIARDDRAPGDLLEPDRGLVFAGDRAGTVDQLRQILAAGYDGPVSMEPFDPAVQEDPALSAHLAASFDFIRAAVN